jgi:hypothetical protein
MSEKASKDPDGSLDRALDALARAERAAWPEVSAGLRARVLADAAETAAAEVAAPAAPTRQRPRRAGGGRPGLIGRLRGLDLWAGAAVTAALICLAIGLGIGYQAGDAVLAEAGLGESVQVAQAGEGDAVFLGEDVL